VVHGPPWPSASPRSDHGARDSLDENDQFTGESEHQRRFAPMVIAKLKTLIDFV
jgi:hypothetical protein